MRSTRRTFLTQSAGAALITTSAFAADEPARREGGDLLSRMTWLNAPASEYYDAGTLTARAKGKTDFWRKTFYGYVTDNGHFLHTEQKGEFTFQARVNGNYSQLYDQAGLMVRLDEKNWMKCGSEVFDGKRWASVVFTRDFSDWSTMEDLSQTGPVYWRVVRKKDSLEAQCSKDGDKFMTIRQGYFPANVPVKVGVMCAAPEGQGFDAVFDQLMLERTARTPG
jgi:uncharacterized protein